MTAALCMTALSDDEDSFPTSEVREIRVAIANGFREQEGKQAARHGELTANARIVESAIRAHGDRLIALERSAESTSESVTKLRGELKEARSAADRAVQLASQALELVAALEARLPRNADHDPAQGPATPPEATKPA